MTCKFETQHTRPYSNHEERFFNPARIFLALPLLAFIAVAGCATPPPLNFSVPNLEVAEKRVDAEVRSITVAVASHDEQVGDIDLVTIEGGGIAAPTGGVVAGVWRTALIEALNRSLVFSDDGTQKVSIAVTILKLEAPSVGFSWTTETVARYEVLDRKNGEAIFVEDISASGTTPVDFAYLGATRERESINRAVQNNIAGFLRAMQASNLVSQ